MGYRCRGDRREIRNPRVRACEGDFRISDVGILTSAGRGGDSRHVATGGTREKERDEGRGEVSAIVWRLINLG